APARQDHQDETLLPGEADDAVQAAEVGFIGSGGGPVAERGLVVPVGGRGSEAGAALEERPHVGDAEALPPPARPVLFRLLRRVAIYKRPGGVPHPEERRAVSHEIPPVLAYLQLAHRFRFPLSPRPSPFALRSSDPLRPSPLPLGPEALRPTPMRLE